MATAKLIANRFSIALVVIRAISMYNYAFWAQNIVTLHFMSQFVIELQALNTVIVK